MGKALRTTFDFLWLALIAGGLAVVIILVCFGYLTFANAGSKTFSLAAAALASALIVFCIQAWFELRASDTKTFITIEYTLNRAGPAIRQWDYGQNVGWRIGVETAASDKYFSARPNIPSGNDGREFVQKLMLDLAVASTLSYLANEHFDWQLKKVSYRGRSGGTITSKQPTSASSECSDLTADDVKAMLREAGNSFMEAGLFLRPKMCLPPGAQVQIGPASIKIITLLLTLDFQFAGSGTFNYQRPGDGALPVPVDDKGDPVFVTSFIGLDVTTSFSAIRSQSRDMNRYKEWAERVVSGAQEWFEDAR